MARSLLQSEAEERENFLNGKGMGTAVIKRPQILSTLEYTPPTTRISCLKIYNIQNEWYIVVRVSLSEPHTNMPSFHTCVYVFLLGPTTYRKSLPSHSLHVHFASCANSKRTPGVEDMNHLPPQR